MKTRLYLGILLCVVLLVLLVVLWPTGEDQRATITFGEIEQLNGEARTPTVGPESVSAPTISPASGPQIPTSVQVAFATSSEQNNIPESGTTQKSLQVSIVDALGDPIESGNLRVGGKEYPFKDGQVSVAVPAGGEQQMVAEAEGYQSATQSVDASVQDETTMTLEYLCSFDFIVGSPKNIVERVPGCDVFLWRSRKATRPVPRTASFITVRNLWEHYKVEGQYAEDGVRIDSVEEKPWERGSVPLPLSREGSSFLGNGDLLVGFPGCPYQPGVRLRFSYPPYGPWDLASYQLLKDSKSPRLRVWDTLVLYGPKDNVFTNAMNMDTVEFERGTERGYASIKTPDPPEENELVSVGTTDSSGRCHFADLLPGLYYVQAQKNEIRSAIVTLHPARAGAEV